MYRLAALAILGTALACPTSDDTSATQGPWQQCGGINWTGGTTCQSGWTCQVQNPYYSQCLQSSSSGSGSSTTSAKPASSTSAKAVATSSSSSSSSTQGPWQQCGGINWTGGTTCQSGWTCQVQNAYYSQCLQASSSSSGSGSGSGSGSSTTSTSAVKSSSTSSSTSKSPTSSTSALASSGTTYKASFTEYGAGDSFGSGNCNTNTAACFFYTQPGYSAAVSQNLYGAGPGDGQGPACGTCWKLTVETDSSGNKLSNAGNSIVVMVNNLCPASGNPLCAQSSLTDTNQYGANVNFDTCMDSGASSALFGNSGVGLAVGTATQVDCSEWSGTVVH